MKDAPACCDYCGDRNEHADDDCQLTECPLCGTVHCGACGCKECDKVFKAPEVVQ